MNTLKNRLRNWFRVWLCVDGDYATTREFDSVLVIIADLQETVRMLQDAQAYQIAAQIPKRAVYITEHDFEAAQRLALEEFRDHSKHN